MEITGCNLNPKRLQRADTVVGGSRKRADGQAMVTEESGHCRSRAAMTTRCASDQNRSGREIRLVLHGKDPPAKLAPPIGRYLREKSEHTTRSCIMQARQADAAGR